MFGGQNPLADDPIAEAKEGPGVDRPEETRAHPATGRTEGLQPRRQARAQQRGRHRAEAGAAGQQVNEWMKDLGETEKAIRELDEKVIPTINAELEELYRKIGAALQSVRATWEDPVGSNV